MQDLGCGLCWFKVINDRFQKNLSDPSISYFRYDSVSERQYITDHMFYI